LAHRQNADECERGEEHAREAEEQSIANAERHGRSRTKGTRAAARSAWRARGAGTLRAPARSLTSDRARVQRGAAAMRRAGSDPTADRARREPPAVRPRGCGNEGRGTALASRHAAEASERRPGAEPILGGRERGAWHPERLRESPAFPPTRAACAPHVSAAW